MYFTFLFVLVKKKRIFFICSHKTIEDKIDNSGGKGDYVNIQIKSTGGQLQISNDMKVYFNNWDIIK